MLAALAAATFAADQLSKGAVFSRLEANLAHPVLDGVLWFTPRVNQGASFSFLAGFGYSNELFLLLNALLTPLILWFAVYRYPQAPATAFGLILGGAAGNVVDRLLPARGVRDFIDLHWWPVFNIADAAIFAGVALLAGWLFFFAPKEEHGQKDEG